MKNSRTISEEKMNLWINTWGVVKGFNAIISLLKEQGIGSRGIYEGDYQNNRCCLDVSATEIGGRDSKICRLFRTRTYLAKQVGQ